MKTIKINPFWGMRKENKFIIEETKNPPPKLKGRIEGGSILLEDWGNYMDAGKNISNYILLLKEGYSTAANGTCTDIYLFPKQSIVVIDKGDASSFAEYEIF